MAHKHPHQQFEITEQYKSGNLLIIHGRKQAPPAKRIVLDSQNFKVVGAKVFRLDKNTATEMVVKRINYLPTMSQVRLHTQETIFPGSFKLELKIK